MTPEELRADLAERVRALEASMGKVQGDQAAMRTELTALRELVQNLGPVSERTAVIAQQVTQLDEDISRVEGKFDKRWERLEQSQADARKDSRSLRNVLIGIAITAVLSPIGGIIVALIVGKP